MRLATKILSLATLAFAGTTSAQAAPSSPVNLISYISGSGSDSNACTLDAPCATIAAAIPGTISRGTIIVLNSGTYGSATITRPVTIAGAGNQPVFYGTFLISGFNGGLVSIENLALNGATSATTSFPSAVYVTSNTNAEVILNKVSIKNYSLDGVDASMNSYARITLMDCVLQGMPAGVWGFADAHAHFKIFNSKFIANSQAGIKVDSATSGDVFIADSHIMGSAKGISLASGAFANSYGNNVITSGDAVTPVILK